MTKKDKLNDKLVIKTKRETVTTQKPRLIEHPLWYLKVRSTIRRKENIVPIAMILPFFIAFVVAMYINQLINHYTYYSSYITLAILLIFFLSFPLVTWKFIIPKKYKLSKLEYFAFYCGSLGLDLNRLSVDSELYTKAYLNLSWLKTYTKKIGRTFKSERDTWLRESFQDFYYLLTRLKIFLRNPENYSDELYSLSERMIQLGSYTYNSRNKPGLNDVYIAPIIQELEKLEERSLRETIKNSMTSLSVLLKESTFLKFLKILFSEFLKGIIKLLINYSSHYGTIVGMISLFFIIFFGAQWGLEIPRTESFVSASVIVGPIIAAKMYSRS